jgi:hypothetical protein
LNRSGTGEPEVLDGAKKIRMKVKGAEGQKGRPCMSNASREPGGANRYSLP